MASKMGKISARGIEDRIGYSLKLSLSSYPICHRKLRGVNRYLRAIRSPRNEIWGIISRLELDVWQLGLCVQTIGAVTL
jgi:hypothetical protein